MRYLNRFINIFYQSVAGFVMATSSMATLLSLIILFPTTVVALVAIIGSLVAISAGLRQFIKEYKKKKLSRFLQDQENKQSNDKTLDEKFTNGPEDPNKRKRFHRLAFINKYFYKICKAIFSLASVIGLALFFEPHIFAHASTHNTILYTSLEALIVIASVNFVAKLLLKTKIRQIEKKIRFYQDIDDDSVENDLISLGTKQEKFSYVYLVPTLSGLISFTTSVTSVFGLVSLFSIGAGLSLPFLTPITLLAFSLTVGLFMGLNTIRESHHENKLKLDYVQYVQEEEKDGKKPKPFILFKKELLDTNENSKHYSHKEYIKGAFHKFTQLSDGFAVGSGMAFVSIGLATITGTLIAPMISIPVIVCAGLLFAGLNYYRLHVADVSEKEMIAESTYQISKQLAKLSVKKKKVFEPKLDEQVSINKDSVEEENDSPTLNEQAGINDENDLEPKSPTYSN